MSDGVAIGKTLRIRDKGLDEYWLQDQIIENLGALGLADDLELFSRERRQSSGGRLDMLLKDAVARRRRLHPSAQRRHQASRGVGRPGVAAAVGQRL